MENITESAGQKLQQTLDEVNAPEDRRIRLSISEEGGRLTLDQQRPGDQVFQHDEREVLLIGPDVAERTTGRTLDFDGGQFRFV